MQRRLGRSVLLGEANVEPPGQTPYFGEHGEGLQMMFNFWVNQHLFYALASGDARPLKKSLEDTRLQTPVTQWVNFLRNHDELDLGRLSEEQRQTVFDRFAPEERMRLYGRGIRRRLAPMLGDPAMSRLAHSVLFSLPGTPVIRYGDEIGMGDDLRLEQREAVRTPMQWSSDRQAGFTTANETTVPVIDTGDYSYRHVNVESQQRDRDSQLNWMRDLIRVRKQTPEIGWGDWRLLDTDSHVLALRYDWRGSTVVTAQNFSDSPCDVHLDADERGRILVDLGSPTELQADADGVHPIALEAYGTRWYRAGDGSGIAQHRRR
jgi:maltose alpha-D-glucosyltransferase/alpha-amylase